MSSITEMMDVFFNGRSPQFNATAGKFLSVAELIEKSPFLIMFDGKHYQITCQEVEVTVKPKAEKEAK